MYPRTKRRIVSSHDSGCENLKWKFGKWRGLRSVISTGHFLWVWLFLWELSREFLLQRGLPWWQLLIICPQLIQSPGFASSLQSFKSNLMWLFFFSKIISNSWLVLGSQSNLSFFFQLCSGVWLCVFGEECFWSKRSIIWLCDLMEHFPNEGTVCGSNIGFSLPEKSRVNKQKHWLVFCSVYTAHWSTGTRLLQFISKDNRPCMGMEGLDLCSPERTAGLQNARSVLDT